MNAIEQISSLSLPVGAKPGQAILFADLSQVENSALVLEQLTHLGYDPQLRYLELKNGLHVVAVLRDESGISDQRYETLEQEWESLTHRIAPTQPNDVVRLWHGLAQPA